MAKPRILVVDDEESIRTQMKWALARDYEVSLAGSAEEAMKALGAGSPELVTLDLGLPPHPEDSSEGLRLLELILQANPLAKVLVVSGNSDKSSALKAISRGASDFFSKPIDIEELKAILKRSHYVYTLESEYRELQKQLGASSFGEIIGGSPCMQEVFTIARKVSTTDVPVLITGESGTGKELVARGIHDNSIRKDGPFIPINCGAIPENLMESELFGHEKGAFTGAHAQRAGRIELARGGTLFLDEIGELPLGLQVKLLRFLQDHKIERVGGRSAIDVDLRVMAATNKDLKKLVKEGCFREDLFFRIAVVSVEVPPLRERGEDIGILARAFLKRFAAPGPAPKYLSDEAVSAISNYEWPGNVRELENRIRRAVTLAEGQAVTAADLGLEPGYAGEVLDMKTARRNMEVKIISNAIAKHSGNISKAAEDLGLTRPTLFCLIKKHGLKAKND